VADVSLFTCCHVFFILPRFALCHCAPFILLVNRIINVIDFYRQINVNSCNAVLYVQSLWPMYICDSGADCNGG
jgi:hypothetical protein